MFSYKQQGTQPMNGMMWLEKNVLDSRQRTKDWSGQAPQNKQ